MESNPLGAGREDNPVLDNDCMKLRSKFLDLYL